MSSEGPNLKPVDKIEDLYINMDSFRREIAALADERRVGLSEYEKFYKELKEKGIEAAEIEKLWESEPRKPINMKELTELDPKHLTKEDAIIWYKLKNFRPGLITEAEFREYAEPIQSRAAFKGLLANKFTPILAKEIMGTEGPSI